MIHNTVPPHSEHTIRRIRSNKETQMITKTLINVLKIKNKKSFTAQTKNLLFSNKSTRGNISTGPTPPETSNITPALTQTEYNRTQQFDQL